MYASDTPSGLNFRETLTAKGEGIFGTDNQSNKKEEGWAAHSV